MHMSTRSIRRKLLSTVAVGGVLAAALSAVVFSAFSSTTTVRDNRFEAGSIKLSDSSQGSALFNASGLEPGDVQTRCLKVSYSSTGSLTSKVRLYGATTGAGLDKYLHLTIARGSFSGAQPSGNDCTGFVPDSAAILYDGPMSAFPTAYDSGKADPDDAWADGESAVYKVTVALDDDDRAQGLDATQELTWEARTS